MDRWLRTAGSVLINILLAIFGTTVIEHPFSLMITVHTIPEILQRTYLLIVVCGCLLGYFVYRIWQPHTARWLWIVGIGWFVLGAMPLLPPSTLRSSSALNMFHYGQLFPALVAARALTLSVVETGFTLRSRHCAWWPTPRALSYAQDCSTLVRYQSWMRGWVDSVR